MRFLRLVLISFAFLAASCGADAEHSVLFVGNSLTYQNDVPAMVESIAGANGVPIDTKTIAIGGATLADHLANPAVADALRSGDYDVVVFQEQSELPSMAGRAERDTIPAAMELDAIADAAGVRVIWFQTWGHRSGSTFSGHTNYETMQDALNATYAEIGRLSGGQVAGAGRRWDQAMKRGVPVDLYAADGLHASPAGSYLAAVAIADTLLIGQPLREAPSVSGVDSDTAWALLSS